MLPLNVKFSRYLSGGGVHDLGVGEEAQLLLAEAEVLDALQDPAGAGQHAVAPALGQAAGEGLEDAGAVRRAGVQGGLQHRQLVVVGEQGGGLLPHGRWAPRDGGTGG